MKSLATALVAESRSTLLPASSKSFASILPDKSTASIKFRPDIGISISSPINSGLALARTRKNQAINPTQRRQFLYCSADGLLTNTENIEKFGTIRPDSFVFFSADNNLLTRKGNGSASNIHGQARVHILVTLFFDRQHNSHSDNI